MKAVRSTVVVLRVSVMATVVVNSNEKGEMLLVAVAVVVDKKVPVRSVGECDPVLVTLIVELSVTSFVCCDVSVSVIDFKRVLPVRERVTVRENPERVN